MPEIRPKIHPGIHPEIRDDNLRLTLADQEGEFIRRKIAACRHIVGVRIVFLAAAIVITAGLAASWASITPAVLDAPAAPNSSFDYGPWVAAGTVLAFCLTLVAGLFLIWSVLDVRRYRDMRREHDEFLRGYGRDPPN